MRCKNHYTDLTSNVGVCASCLRQRLCSLVAAQEQPQPQPLAQTLDEQIRKSETHPSDPLCPRSVSPYITRRKTDNSASSTNSNRNRHSLPDRRFFSTPQLTPIAGSYNPFQKKYSFIRFSLSNLFRSKKRKEDSNPRSSVCDSNHRGSCGGGDTATATSAMSSPFWSSNVMAGGGCRKKQPFCFSEASTASGAGVIRKQYCSDRGMSPVRYSDCGGAEDEFYDGSIGYETGESRKQTPRRTPAHPSVRRGGGREKNASVLNFCLSPLVRVSPCRQWKHKGVAPVDYGGEIRAPVKAHLSNRSRKVADFGRYATDR